MGGRESLASRLGGGGMRFLPKDENLLLTYCSGTPLARMGSPFGLLLSKYIG